MRKIKTLLLLLRIATPYAACSREISGEVISEKYSSRTIIIPQDVKEIKFVENNFSNLGDELIYTIGVYNFSLKSDSSKVYSFYIEDEYYDKNSTSSATKANEMINPGDYVTVISDSRNISLNDIINIRSKQANK